CHRFDDADRRALIQRGERHHIARRVHVWKVGSPSEKATAIPESKIARDGLDRPTFGPIADDEPTRVGNGLDDASEGAREGRDVFYRDKTRDDRDIPSVARKLQRRDRFLARG